MEISRAASCISPAVHPYAERNDNRQNAVSPVSASAGRRHVPSYPVEDEVQFQEALIRSLADTGAVPFSEDHELQEALHQSCLQAAGRLSPTDSGTSESSSLLQGLVDSLELRRLDVGSRNLNEGGHLLSNQCFYLAIARSWLAGAAQGSGLLVRDSALQLKREIESSVVGVRGEAAYRDIGEETEAYADFLACAMSGEGPVAGSAMADLAIVVFASSAGVLEAYEGRGYAKLPRDQRVANLALVWHRPGHFEAIVALSDSGKADLTLEDLLHHAETVGIPAALVKA